MITLHITTNEGATFRVEFDNTNMTIEDVRKYVNSKYDNWSFAEYVAYQSKHSREDVTIVNNDRRDVFIIVKDFQMKLFATYNRQW